MPMVETLAKWKENQIWPILKVQAIGSKKGCMEGNGGPKNSKCNYRGVRQRAWGKWVTEIRQPKGGKRLWLGTFSNAMDAALTYDEAARTMYGSCARLNFPNSCSATTSSSICSVETPTWFDSTNTSNNFEVFAVGDSKPVSPNLRNEDGESIAFVDIEAARATFAIEDIMHVSPNVMNEDGEGELRANTQHSAVADTNTPSSTIQGDHTCHFTDEMFDLDDISEFNDDFFCNVKLLFEFDFNVGQLGFLGVDQSKKPLDITHSCKIQMTSCWGSESYR
jgi:hypothetical protein